MQICHYLLNIRKCKNNKCYDKYRALDAAILLNENNGLLSRTTKGKDGHFINPIHAFNITINSKFQSTIIVTLQFYENYISIYVVAYVANTFRPSSSQVTINVIYILDVAIRNQKALRNDLMRQKWVVCLFYSI